MTSSYQKPINKGALTLANFILHFFVCLCVLFLIKLGIDALISHLPLELRRYARPYYQLNSSLSQPVLLGLTKLHLAWIALSFLFPFSRVSMSRLTGSMINATLIMPLNRLIYYRFLGWFFSLLLSPVLGPLGMVIVLISYLQKKSQKENET
ncbi:hypothetical protein [Thiopseudomonas alkaliphila]|uniref:hypothetical protein n=1 Tax=Thiopseudomonas alkaliphila TaxID=1697053 RepID=UPI0025788B57|nr:hypothetical protein [Thiopseudomonas alkaliphila]MDM1717427.1 hypothetical protein [Thiopseudomonas alkaliphila]